MVHPQSHGKRALACVAAAACLAFAGAAVAQSMNANSAGYNAGYGRSADQENQPVDVTMRDANGNLVITDGIIQPGQDQSIFANGGSTGVLDTVAGAGGGSAATAIGNSLNVVVQGSNNTVIVNSVQTNKGAVTATTSLSGGASNAQ
jgi:holdfast attachment protein HfaA